MFRRQRHGAGVVAAYPHTTQRSRVAFHVTWADDPFLIANNRAEAQEMLSEVVDALRQNTASRGGVEGEGLVGERVCGDAGRWLQPGRMPGPRSPGCLTRQRNGGMFGRRSVVQ